MSWNYRVIEDEEGYYSLREVYYNEEGEPSAHCSVQLVEYDDPAELQRELRVMLRAAKQPSIHVNDMNAATLFGPGELDEERVPWEAVRRELGLDEDEN